MSCFMSRASKTPGRSHGRATHISVSLNSLQPTAQTRVSSCLSTLFFVQERILQATMQRAAHVLLMRFWAAQRSLLTGEQQQQLQFDTTGRVGIHQQQSRRGQGPALSITRANSALFQFRNKTISGYRQTDSLIVTMSFGKFSA